MALLGSISPQIASTPRLGSDEWGDQLGRTGCRSDLTADSIRGPHPGHAYPCARFDVGDLSGSSLLDRSPMLVAHRLLGEHPPPRSLRPGVQVGAIPQARGSTDPACF